MYDVTTRALQCLWLNSNDKVLPQNLHKLDPLELRYSIRHLYSYHGYLHCAIHVYNKFEVISYYVIADTLCSEPVQR